MDPTRYCRINNVFSSFPLFTVGLSRWPALKGMVPTAGPATPPSIAIEALVLGGPERMRVVLSSSRQWPHRYYWVTLGGRVSPSPARRRLTACVIAGCVGHASVHCDSGPRAWGSGERARCVFHSSSWAPLVEHLQSTWHSSSLGFHGCAYFRAHRWRWCYKWGRAS